MRRFLPATFLLVLAATLTACPPTTVEKPVIKSFTSSVTGDKLPVGGGNVTLSWTTTGATEVNLAALPASPVPVLGADKVTATVTGVKVDTTFTLTAKNSAGDTVTDTKKITVTAAASLPVITKFNVKTATQPTETKTLTLPIGGGSVTFVSAVTNATSLSIDKGVGAVTPLTGGNTNFTVTTAGDYTLTAKNADGVTVTDKVTISINADATKPKIVAASSTPANGAPGIDKALAGIVVTFDEAMNKTATQAAYTGNEEIAPANVTFTWNAAGTVLTIDPNAELKYDAITDPNGLAKVYTYKFGAGATDLAGNTLEVADQADRTFKTKRNITQTIEANPALTGEVVYSVTPAGNKYFPAEMEAGDTVAFADISSNVAWKGMTGFNLATVPDGVTAVTLISATLKVNQFNVIGNPLATLGVVRLEHITYSGPDLNNLTSRDEAYRLAPLRDLGVISNSTKVGLAPNNPEEKTLSVLPAVVDDLTNKVARQVRSTYRLRFTNVTDNDATQDTIEFSGNNDPKLVLNYIIP
jgi:hypothetical protein